MPQDQLYENMPRFVLFDKSLSSQMDPSRHSMQSKSMSSSDPKTIKQGMMSINSYKEHVE